MWVRVFTQVGAAKSLYICSLKKAHVVTWLITSRSYNQTKSHGNEFVQGESGLAFSYLLDDNSDNETTKETKQLET